MTTSIDIAQMIDHALLKPEITVKDVEEGCRIAKEYGTAAVCVKPSDVALSAKLLKDTGVLVTTVAGFPHGSSTTETKVFETEQAIRDGAVEIDMVLNYGRLLSGEFDYVEKDVKAVVDAAHKHDVIVKVIFENCYLTDELKVEACKICIRAGADFVKTSTGFGSGGATIPDLKLMRANCPPHVKIKAAGGIKTLDSVLKVKAAGATRVGTSSTTDIMDKTVGRESKGAL